MNKRLITDLANQGTNLLNIFNEVMLGTTEVSPYSPTKVYNTGDLVLHFNSPTNKYDLLQCNEDLVTGLFNVAKWIAFQPLLDTDGSIDCGEF